MGCLAKNCTCSFQPVELVMQLSQKHEEKNNQPVLDECQQPFVYASMAHQMHVVARTMSTLKWIWKKEVSNWTGRNGAKGHTLHYKIFAQGCLITI